MGEEIEDLEGELRKLAEVHFPEKGFRGFSEADHGASHYTCFVQFTDGEELVFKLSCAEGSGLPKYESRFSINAPVIKTVDKLTSVPVPKVHYYDNSQNQFDYQYLILEKLSGSNLFHSCTERTDISKEVGSLLAILHDKIRFEETGKLDYNDEELYVEKAGRWPKMYREIMRKLSSNLEDTKISEYQEKVMELIDQNLNELKTGFEPSLVHQEFGPRNIMIDSKTISGVIDWERSISASPEYDLFLAEKHMTSKGDGSAKIREDADKIRESLFEGYQDVRELEEGWRKRRYLYHLAYIVQMMWVLEGDENLVILKEQFSDIKEELENRSE